MLDLGGYDVVVAGAGVTGIVASVAAARQGARTCLVEGSGILGGLITGGRLTKPTGVVQPGVYQDLIERAAGYGGADPTLQTTYWGSYSGIFDPEVMQRVVIETLRDNNVDVLLYAQVIDTLKRGGTLSGLQLQTKSGTALVTGRNFVDTTGDGDVSVLAGGQAMVGRRGDGLMQPMTIYFRIIGVDMQALIEDCKSQDDMLELVVPGGPVAPDAVVTDFQIKGFGKRIEKARSEGFDWTVPRVALSLKSGMLPGEINVNANRFHGNALDPIDRSRAAIELRTQAYCVLDFLKGYVAGFENARLLEIAPVLGVRETRRIVGEYVLTADDVYARRRFPDAIGLCTDPLDVHDPSGDGGLKEGVGDGFGIPMRALRVRGVANLAVAGRCVSCDEIACGSVRNTPACALTGEAAGTAAGLASRSDISLRELAVHEVQARLADRGVVLGTSDRDVVPHLRAGWARNQLPGTPSVPEPGIAESSEPVERKQGS